MYVCMCVVFISSGFPVPRGSLRVAARPIHKAVFFFFWIARSSSLSSSSNTAMAG